ncbi:hypothetical protein Droror1_Dr00015208 [Drosera rotundifolia]
MAIAVIMNLNDDNTTTDTNSNNNDDDHHNHHHEQLQLLHHQDQLEEHPPPPPSSHDDHEHDMVMPGFRFHPTEEELVEFYLRRKVEGKKFNVELITFLDLYRYDPWELPALAAIGEKEWFFYVPRDRKYRNGDRPNRVTTSGYWKATGADRMIRAENFRPIGLKKTLVFYSGKAPKGIRTSWIMNEYRLPQHETERYQKIEISLCRVYKRAGVEDHPSVPRGSLPEKASSSRATATAAYNSESSSAVVAAQKKPSFRGSGSAAARQQLMDHQLQQLEKMSTTSAAVAASASVEADTSSSTEVGTALGLSHDTNNNNSSNTLTNSPQQLVSHLEINKMMLLATSGGRGGGGHPSLRLGTPETAPLSGGAEDHQHHNHHQFFIGDASSSSPQSNNPGMILDDLHRLVTYQQACMMNNQQHQEQQQFIHPNMSHASSHHNHINPTPLFSSLLSQSSPLGLNAAAMAASGSSLGPLTGFPDRLWDWNSLPEPGRDYNGSFK